MTKEGPGSPACGRLRSPSRTPVSASEPEAPPGARPTRSYGSGARLLSVGIAATGLLTFAYFSIASHVLDGEAAQRLDVLWSVMFVVISVIYRPVEQLLSRTIAERRAHGHAAHPLRVPLALQAGFALAFLVVALALHEELVDHVFDGYAALYWVLVVGTLAYAGSYFARGWLAGHQYFGLFGALVLMESTSRICFALAVALGLASGQTAVALGIAAAPLLSLVVVPAAFARSARERGGAGAGPLTADEADAALAGPGTEGVQEVAAHDDLSLRPRRALRALGLGDHALRADAFERVGVDGRRALARQGTGRHRLQRDADRARAFAALPGDPDVPFAASHRPGGA